MRKARNGDTIEFQRKKQVFEGLVEIERENSVIVSIKKEAAAELDYETNRTVVKHGNYTVTSMDLAR
ncbi:DUF2187 family protein [Mesobacillus zeae]|uniref:DUF2187 family protein n=1 Tax=Mesobacillus zeae TaxID=1917180 RepID=UPI00300912F7